MSQADIINLLKKEKIGISAKEIANKLKLCGGGVRKVLRRLTKIGEISRIDGEGTRFNPHLYTIKNDK